MIGQSASRTSDIKYHRVASRWRGYAAKQAQEVKHVCSKCGDDAMLCSATKPGSGGMKDMKDMKKDQK